jgi:hypothetical protein
MPRATDDDVRNAELTAGLNRAREIGDIAEMWRCAAELSVMDRRRGAKHAVIERRNEPPARQRR